METIADRFCRINERIESTCEKAGRDPGSVKLIVVTKKQPIDKIVEVIKAGATLLGENYPEEAVVKKKSLPVDVNTQWHMIGHIQSRKIKYIVDCCDFIHTIDRLEIAQKLDRAFQNAGKKIPVLIEVNISGEDSKYGYRIVAPEFREQLISDIGKMMRLDSLDLRGFMTMPPFTTAAEESLLIFRKCRALQIEVQQRLGLIGFDQLSMGTSQDYEIAIREGATYLRIGEAIMGKRTLQ